MTFKILKGGLVKRTYTANKLNRNNQNYKHVYKNFNSFSLVNTIGKNQIEDNKCNDHSFKSNKENFFNNHFNNNYNHNYFNKNYNNNTSNKKNNNQNNRYNDNNYNKIHYHMNCRSNNNYNQFNRNYNNSHGNHNGNPRINHQQAEAKVFKKEYGEKTFLQKERERASLIIKEKDKLIETLTQSNNRLKTNNEKLTKQVSYLESLQQTNQIMKDEMTRLYQNKIAFEKEKFKLEDKIEVLKNEKRILTEDLKQIENKNDKMMTTFNEKSKSELIKNKQKLKKRKKSEEKILKRINELEKQKLYENKQGQKIEAKRHENSAKNYFIHPKKDNKKGIKEGSSDKTNSEKSIKSNSDEQHLRNNYNYYVGVLLI